MTKFGLTRTAGRWRPRSRTYVALAILFVTAWPTNAKDLTLPDPKLTPGAIRHDLSHKEICAYASCGSTPTLMENSGQGSLEDFLAVSALTFCHLLPNTESEPTSNRLRP